MFLLGKVQALIRNSACFIGTEHVLGSDARSYWLQCLFSVGKVVWSGMLGVLLEATRVLGSDVCSYWVKYLFSLGKVHFLFGTVHVL